jgi:DNA-binding response OmpR family regulator
MDTLLRQSGDKTDASPVSQQAESVKPLILVAEDHEDTRFMLMYLLEARGYRVTVAEDGERAVSAAEQEHPDLILMDANLPRLDGLAAAGRIRRLDALARVPIVFLSGHAEASFRAMALETGGDDYLVKPFELSDLDSVLERHLGKSGAAETK